MRVAHLTTVDLSLRYLVLPQLTAVIDLGGEAIGISADGPYVEELEALGIRHIALPGATRSVDPRRDLQAMVALWRTLREERPDVLHTHTPKPGLYGRVLGRLAGVPAVLNTIHGLYATPDDAALKRLVVYTLEAFAARFSDLELVQSAEDYDLVTARRITRPSRTVHLGNGVDLTRFDPSRGSPEERNATRATFGAGPDQVVVGSVGRLVAEKGFLELLEAVEPLDDRIKVVIAGPHEPDKADAVDAGTIERARARGVVFLGMRDDVDVLYRAMDVFVLASHREGFPRAAMEAAASGVPTIATDIRGCREVVEDGVNGVLVPVRDPAALRSAIERLASDPELRAAMASAARAKALRDFDEARIVQTVIRAQVRALRSSGRFERLADRPMTLRPAEPDDAAVIARLHLGESTRRSSGATTRAFRRLIGRQDGVVLVADDGYGPCAFVAGLAGGGRWSTPPPGVGLGSRSGLSLVSLVPGRRPPLPADLRPDAELLAIGVPRAFIGTGVAEDLAAAFNSEISAGGGRRVGAMVRRSDTVRVRLLEAAGFASEPSLDGREGVVRLFATI